MTGPQDLTDILLDVWAEDQRDWVALEHDGQQVTIWELADRARRAAHVLTGASGPVAISTTSPVTHTVAALGAWLAGRPALLVDDAHPAPLLADVVARAGATTTVGRSVPGVDHVEDAYLTAGEPLERRFRDPDGVGTILLTSGSTGAPKLVQRSRNADLHAAMNLALGRLPIVAGDRNWVSIPYATVGFLTQVMGSLMARATVVFGAYQRDTVDDFLSTHRITIAYLVPTMIRLAHQQGGLDGPGWRNLRTLMTGGEKLDGPTASILLQQFKGRLLLAYGSTEAPGPTEADADELAERPGTVGRPIPMRGVRVVTPGTDQDVPVGDEGEVMLTGPDMFTGYIGQEPVGMWYRTGDLGSLDADGYLYITGRASSTVNVGGNRVSTDEVAATLHRHESVAQAAVIAVDDPTWTVRLEGFVVLKRDADVTGDELREWLKGQMSAYKAPRRIRVLEDLPVDSSGKLSRTTLRRLAEDEQ